MILLYSSGVEYIVAFLGCFGQGWLRCLHIPSRTTGIANALERSLGIAMPPSSWLKQRTFSGDSRIDIFQRWRTPNSLRDYRVNANSLLVSWDMRQMAI